ncbi:MAG: polymer-forming cytoskeletal protein [Acidiphilium sp.]|nr:polymer-forming cytoskeletal protein [Acidiphilium sp.]MDD4934371.1 polymer-forming cytoskeletal protein [Acidiphilium sp.]
MISFRKRDEQPTEPKPTVGPGAAPAAKDDGLSMPPFRPAAAAAATPFSTEPPTEQETPMARSPFAPNPPTPTPAAPPASPLAGAGFRPTMNRGADTAERRTLVVGRGISVQGVVQDAERLVVEGTVEATMINATELSITQGGVFKGEAEVEEAEIAGTIDGTLTARHALIVRATGRVLGTARCRRLQVEDGGQITGRIEMITEGAPKAE